jgi:hypothetical protein
MKSTNGEVCRWVIEQLEYIDKNKWARTLESFWQYRDVCDLVDILEAAQFPDPMPLE